MLVTKKGFWCSNYKILGCVAISTMLLLQMHNVDRASAFPCTHSSAQTNALAQEPNAQTIEDLARHMLEAENTTSVMFSVPGLYVPIKLALDMSYPLQAEERWEPLPRSHTGGGIGDAPRLFVAITTACCQQISTDRRKAIRETWVSISKKTTSNVDVAFFVSQARNASVLEEWASKLEVLDFV
jgi:hypothetical protein